MTTPGSWGETPAGLLLNRGLVVEPPFAQRAREFESVEHRQAVADFQTALDNDPSWRFSRELQHQLAARGWTGTWLAVESSVPAALRPLYTAAVAAGAVTYAQPRTR